MHTQLITKPLVEHDDVALYREPPPVYLDWVNTSGAFFDSPDWANVVQQGMNAECFYLWDARHALGHSLTCFRKGPARIGYLGFPVCASANVGGASYDLKHMMEAIRVMRGAPQMLRVPMSAYGNRTLDGAETTATVIESCIPDLAVWRADATSVRRRDLNFAEKRCAATHPARNVSGNDLYGLYAGAVTRHRGSRRYTPGYFDALAAMAGESPVQVFGIADDNGLASMVLVARHGATSYYLHGGTRPDALRLGAADMLMAQAIANAQDRGAARFNFLSSPKEQKGLIRFKKKWGGISQPAQTIDIAINAAGRVLKWLLG